MTLCILNIEMNGSKMMKKLTTILLSTALLLSAPVSFANEAYLTSQKNKVIVTEFYQKLFGDKDLSAIDQYLTADYIQHNPSVADGAAAIKAAAKVWFKDAPKEKIDFLRVAADGDLVFLHLKTKGDTGKDAAVVDIFRLKDGKIVEHWDVIQDVPEQSANAHPMF